MAKFDVKLKNFNTVVSALRELGDDVEEVTARVINDTLDQTKANVNKNLDTPSSGGRIYKRGPGRNLSPIHKASPPGAFPNTDTGELKRRTQVTEYAKPAPQMRGVIGTNLKYGLYLERGTSKMAKRPWLRPSFRKATKDMIQELGREILRRTK